MALVYSPHVSSYPDKLNFRGVLYSGMSPNGIGNRLSKIRQLRQSEDKFTKGQAYYVDDAYQSYLRCRDCVHFREGRCNIVTEEGSPGDGHISPDGTCALFNARAPRIRFHQMMWGRGMLDGVSPEVARASAFMFTYAALDEEPPEDLLEKALWTPEQAQRIMPRK